MKTKKLLPVSLSIIILLPIMGGTLAQEKSKVGVVDFRILVGKDRSESAGIYTAELGKIAADHFITALRGQFEVVERDALKKILGEQALELSGVLEEKREVIGRLKGVDYIAIGDILNYYFFDGRNPNERGGASAEVAVRLIDLRDGKVVFVAQSHGEVYSGKYWCFTRAIVDDVVKVELVTRAIKDAIVGGEAPKVQILKEKRIVQQIQKFFSPNGIVIDVGSGGGVVTIDLGTQMGIEKGNEFVISREGEAITHPLTGETLPGEMTEIGTGKISDVDQLTSSLKIKVKKGLEVKVGDKVYLQD